MSMYHSSDDIFYKNKRVVKLTQSGVETFKNYAKITLKVGRLMVLGDDGNRDNCPPMRTLTWKRTDREQPSCYVLKRDWEEL